MGGKPEELKVQKLLFRICIRHAVSFPAFPYCILVSLVTTTGMVLFQCWNVGRLIRKWIKFNGACSLCHQQSLAESMLQKRELCGITLSMYMLCVSVPQRREMNCGIRLSLLNVSAQIF